MNANPAPSVFWIRWLLAAAAGVVLFGLVLVLAPGAARQGFSLLVYASPDRIDTFGAEPARYIGLAHAVIGSVMVGWGVALFQVTRTLLARGDRAGWQLLALSVAAWFVPDTAYSLLSGYWPNAVLNTGFLLLFVLPLWGTRGVLRQGTPARAAAALRAGS
ncbi:MAG: hypothetical protein KF683_25115 [Rubrivivax sp.]|nr:hypothetical protein [Rubrivivax sp.]